MKLVKLFWNLTLPLFIAIMIACSGGGGGGGGSPGGGTGTLSIALTDSSCSGYKAIYVTIDEVQVNKNGDSSNGNSGWQTVASPMKTYNLLKLVNGVSEVLGEDELAAGAYKQIRLIIGKTPESENNINGEPHPSANYVVLNDYSYGILKIPSGYQTGVKLVHNFEVEESSFVELLLDFEACKSVVETGSGKYILKPTIKVIETQNKSEVYGEVAECDTDPAIPVIGALVSAQISDGLSASVVRSTLTSDVAGEKGQYSLLLSPGQTYNLVVVYSDDKVGDPGSEKLYSFACEQVTVPDENLEQKFCLDLDKSEFGTITVYVEVNGVIDPIEAERPVVYISFFSWALCGLNEDYIEVTSTSMIPDKNGDISYSVELPLGVYDVVASSQGFVPDTLPGRELVNPGDSIEVNLVL